MIKFVTNYPSTIPAAVDAVLDDLPRETLDQIASVGGDELIKMHLIVGSHLRNTLGLWAGNRDLLNACGKPHPDDASLGSGSGPTIEISTASDHCKSRCSATVKFMVCNCTI
jgi:hypothetical protein